jgi:hypothetical protein
MSMNIKKMLPFLEEEELDALAKKIIDSPDKNYKGITIQNILPFLEDETIDVLLKDAVSKNEDYHQYLPFASDEVIDEMFLVAAKNGQPYSSFLPFVSDECLSKLIDEYIHGTFEIDIDKLYPFLEDDDIRKLFKHELNKD